MAFVCLVNDSFGPHLYTFDQREWKMTFAAQVFKCRMKHRHSTNVILYYLGLCRLGLQVRWLLTFTNWNELIEKSGNVHLPFKL